MHTIDLSIIVNAKDPCTDKLFDLLRAEMPRGMWLETPNALLRSPDGSVVYQYCFHLFVDCLEMFGVRTITIVELLQIIPCIDAALKGTGLTADDFKVCRIDYAYSTVVEDEIARHLILDALNEKAPTHAGYLRFIYEYPTSFRRDTKSHSCRTVNIYDKNQEREDKGIPPKPYEKDVIRCEMQVKTEHIKYQAKGEDCDRRLSSWLTVKQFRHYISQTVQFVFRGDFYTLEAANEEIDKYGCKPFLKKRLKAFLAEIATSNMDTVLEKYAPQTIKKYISALDNLNINPITIPDGYGYTSIPTPFNYDGIF